MLRRIRIGLFLALSLCATGCATGSGPDKLDEGETAVDDRSEVASVAAAAPDDSIPVDVSGAQNLSTCRLGKRSQPIEVAPLPDADVTPFLKVIDGARTSLDVMIYRVGYSPITDALVRAANRGVSVRMIIDHAHTRDDEYAASRLTRAGATVHWADTKFPYMHAKMLVADDDTAIVTSSNFPIGYFRVERNFVATDRDPKDVSDLEALFEADWTGKDPKLDCTRMIVSPINSRARIVDLVDSATSELLVESMQLSDHSVRAAVKRAAQRGVKVRVILADVRWITSNQTAIDDLAKAGITARQMSSLDVHVKSIIVDGKEGLVGSTNFSWTSLSRNREISLVAENAQAVDTMTKTFEQDWSRRAY